MATKAKNKNINKRLSLKRFSKIQIVLFVLPFAALASFLLLKSFAVTPSGTYNNWFWPASENGFYNMDHHLTVEKVSTDKPYFWAHQFKLKNGDGGYLGLQSAGSRVDGTRGKTAVFSIFGANVTSTSPGCKTESAGFDGGPGGGTSCRVAYDWVEGRTYRLRIWQLDKNAQGTLWGARVIDTSNNQETQIAHIRVPLAWGGLADWSSTWTEYFGGQVSSCDLFPYSRVRITNVTVNDNTIPPVRSEIFYGNGDCKNSKITAVSGGYVQEMGNQSYGIQTIDTTAPSVPKNLRIGGQEYSYISIHWDTSSDNIKTTGYNVFRDGAKIATVPNGSTGYYTDSSVSINSTYSYTVTAFDAAGNESAKSNTISASACYKALNLSTAICK